MSSPDRKKTFCLQWAGFQWFASMATRERRDQRSAPRRAVDRNLAAMDAAGKHGSDAWPVRCLIFRDAGAHEVELRARRDDRVAAIAGGGGVNTKGPKY